MSATPLRKLRFHYFDNRTIGSWIIKARLSTAFSHCAVEFEDGALIHSTMTHGTVKETLAEQPHAPKHTTEVYVTEERYLAARAWAESILGTKYDWKGIVGFIVAKSYQSNGAYFCSETARTVFEIGVGFTIKRHTLITPGQLRLMTDTYVLATAQGAITVR